ncbi:hypothetical protein FA13DRAFT_1846007 [Coprinellus micaceus]|uniref:CBM21 domain-containing protein n=1 Tax=Coprinellus micaceus TaxID=71717 RepID=A0A4Y7TBJ0_COPMI|nr:hypothetical protein FA13DRAFT_1846007 [Coprinellus micaceus]
MIATVSAKPIRMPHHHQHLYSNTSAGPLPTIPRRASSSRQVVAPVSKPGPSTTHRSTSASSGSDTASASTQVHLSIRARRARTAQAQGHFPPELVNPIPPLARPHVEPIVIPGSLRASKTEDNITTISSKKASSQFLYSPGMTLRGLGLETRTPMSTITSAPGRPNDGSGLIRKKSGQLVKPSLKTSRSTSGGEGLSTYSKSEPATPSFKAVHFDSQLEHVKLFLAEQKPLAVSRDGSPTDDTSGTDSDFPSFIFWERRETRTHEVDHLGEETSVAPGNNAILGRVRVRNIAFVKTVAIRFTFDSWQTTSEVVGHYHDSPSSDFDRFFFTIRLDDLLARIEEKTLVLAVRYSVVGRDYWDNNCGQDYVAKFSRSTPRDRSLSDEESSENLVSLQTKLEKVVQGNERSTSTSSTSPSRSSPRPSPRSSPEPESEEPTFKSTSSLAARYDLNASFKNPWKYNDSPPTSHQRNNSYPQFAKPSRPPKAAASLSSPRDLADGVIPDTPASAHADDTPFEVRSREPHGRNHHRGYFDLSTFGAANVRRTPPTSPRSQSPDTTSPTKRDASSPPVGFYPFPTAESTKRSPSPELAPHRPPSLVSGLFSSDTGFESELSTPSLTTPNSSRSTTPSPTEQFLSLPPVADDDSPQNAGTHYRELINQYCFFTGGTPAGQDNSAFTFSFPKTLRETPASDAFGLDSTPKPHSDARMRSPSPISSNMYSSLDDLVSIGSGSITPTASRFNLHLDSRSPTPTVIIHEGRS